MRSPWDWPPFGVKPRHGFTEVIDAGDWRYRGADYSLQARYTLLRNADRDGASVHAEVHLTRDGSPVGSSGSLVSPGPSSLRWRADAGDTPAICALWEGTFGKYWGLMSAISRGRQAVPDQRCQFTGAWLSDAELWR